MLRKIPIILLLLTFYVNPVYADDFDGGIDLDEPIKDNLQTGLNIEYIKRNVKSKVARGTAIVYGCEGIGNQTFGPGTNLRGATIVNLSNNKGTNTLCNKKNRSKR